MPQDPQNGAPIAGASTPIAAADETEVESPVPSSVEGIPVQAVTNFFATATNDGLFPAVAFGLDPRGAPQTIGLATTSISDFPTAIDIVERVIREPVTPYRFIPLRRLKSIVDMNRIMKFKRDEIPGLNTNESEHRRLVSHVMMYCTASRWPARSFLLVDMVGFSLSSTPEQLSLRMSLGQSINQCVNRMRLLARSGYLPWKSTKGFNRISTGDGFYIWNYDSSEDGHVALFLLMILLATQTRALHDVGTSPLKLRLAYAIGEAYIFPYDGPGLPPSGADHGFMPDAIGPVLNQLQRFLSVAGPWQIIVAPFDLPGRESRPDERLSVSTMLTRIRSEVLPGELQPHESVKSQDIELTLDPETVLRISDKHGIAHHCYNVCGKVPNRISKPNFYLQSIGLATDQATDLQEARFKVN